MFPSNTFNTINNLQYTNPVKKNEISASQPIAVVPLRPMSTNS